jgi:surfeit locus 1 family protein
MSMRRLLWPTLITLPCVGILIAFGSWQVERLHWKQSLIDERAAALAADPIALPRDLSAPEGLEFRRVVVRGKYLHERELYVLNRAYKSRAGLHIITPLRRTAGAGGGVVLINRGWAPLDRRDPATRPGGQIAGQVEVTGIVRVGVTARGKFTPANDPVKGLWFAPDPRAMARAADVAAPEIIIEAGPAKNIGGLPLGGQTMTTLTNSHLSYVLTWYGLAIALIVIYLIYLFRSPEEPAAN